MIEDNINIKTIKDDSDILLIAFNSRKPNKRGFEFLGLREKLKYNGIFIYDEQLLWYQNGLTNIGSNIDEIIYRLNNHIKFNFPNIKKIICLGYSMGGFGCLTIGTQLRNVTKILALSPQTSLNLERLKNIKDIKQYETIKYLNLNNDYTNDVNNFLKYKKIRGNIEIFYCDKQKPDEEHAKYLNINCKLISLSCESHDTVSQMKNQYGSFLEFFKQHQD